jgi:hypothetical protein
MFSDENRQNFHVQKLFWVVSNPTLIFKNFIIIISPTTLHCDSLLPYNLIVHIFTMTGLSWNCPVCTYFHHSHGTRCSMCGSLRTTKSDMIDFIQGKTLAVSQAGTRKLDEEIPTSKDERLIHNPYLHKTKSLAVRQETMQFNDTKICTSNPTAPNNKMEQGPTVVHATGNSSDTRTQMTMMMNDKMIPSEYKDTCEPHKASHATLTSATSALTHLPYSHPVGHTMDPTATNAGNHAIVKSVQSTSNPYRKNNNTLSSNRTQFVGTGTAVVPPATGQALVPNMIKQTHAHRIPEPISEANAHLDNPFTIAARAVPPTNHNLTYYQPGPVPLDQENSTTWIYPQSDSYRERKYQLDICQTGKKSPLILQNHCK